MTTKPIKKNFKHNIKLTILLAVIVFVALIVLSAIYVNYLERAARTQTQKELANLSDSISDSVYRQMLGDFQTLDGIAFTLSQLEFDQPTDLAPLLALINQNNSFLRMGYASTDGEMKSFNKSGEPMPLINLADEVFFQTALSGKWAIQNTIPDPFRKNKWIVRTAVPVKHNGSVIGVLVAVHDVSVYRNMIDAIIFNGKGYFNLMDSEGGLVIRTSNDLPNPHALTFDELGRFSDDQTYAIKKQINLGNRGNFTFTDTRNTVCYAVYQPIGLADWFILGVVDQDYISAAVIQASMGVLIIVGLSLITVVLCFCALLRTMLRNQKRLASDAEQLRLSEEQYRIATDHSERIVARYDIKNDIYHTTRDCNLTKLGFPEEIKNVPQVFIDKNLVASESVDAFIRFYAKIRQGIPESDCIVRLRNADDSVSYYQINATVINDKFNQPSQAIITYQNVTDRREKELVFEKWQQTLHGLDANKFTLYTCNLTGKVFELTKEGNLLNYEFDQASNTLDKCVIDYVLHKVHPDDREYHLQKINREALLSGYYRGNNKQIFEYRELTGGNDYRWIRLDVELVEYPDSTDIKAYMLFEDVDAEKKAQLLAIKQSESDPLTNVLNRSAFSRNLNRVASESKTGAQHAFMMLDIDWFKRINDAYGHDIGDQVLIDLVARLRSLLRPNDFIGRLGGDEFCIFMPNVPYDAVIEQKAKQICETLSVNNLDKTQISVSVGVSIYPRDGENFDALYKAADIALYHIKNTGKNRYALYSRNMRKDDTTAIEREYSPEPSRAKPRMLVVDDNEMNREILVNLFSGDFNVMQASDGHTALEYMRRYGSGINIVLLDLMMPVMDGFEVMARMRESVEARSIPVIVVSGGEETDISLKAIESGASDYVSKPINPSLIRFRVQSTIAKSENERLRAQNSYLQLQNDAETLYRTVLSCSRTSVVQYDAANDVFNYDHSLNELFCGEFDERKLWDIFIEDNVTDAQNVEIMKNLVNDLIVHQKSLSGCVQITANSAQRELKWYSMSVFKVNDLFRISSKLIIVFKDIDEEKIADLALIQRAERDSLTGLYNRQTFLKKADELVKNSPANSYSFVYFDIDRFKAINEMFGYVEGDDFLKYIARVISDRPGEYGLCCRVSADIFAMCVKNGDYDLKESLLNDFCAELRKYSARYSITASFGVYLISDRIMPIDAMLDNAAMAQRSIKGGYKNNVAYWSADLYEKELEERELANSMKTALAEEQFAVYLQPIYDHSTHEMVSAEALARWIHPEKGVIAPNVFIPLFEKNGFVTELDSFVFDKVCAFQKYCLDNNIPTVPISVNLSRVDLFNPNLAEEIFTNFDKFAISPSLLRFEITESAFAKDEERILSTVKKIRAKGFLVEMDDFGSGYSSLNALKNISVDIIKLDMRFLIDDDEGGRGGSIIGSIIRMTKWLRLPVIAEGVETQTQADFLQSLGCNYVQGYLYAKPMKINEFVTLISMSAISKIKDEQKFIENLDISAIENPNSLESLVFSNFLGASCLFEYSSGKIEILRANKDYLVTLNLEEKNFLEYQLNLFSTMDENNLKKYHDMLTTAILTNGVAEAVTERRLVKNCDIPTFIRSKVRVIAKGDNRFILYGVIENVTAREIAFACARLLSADANLHDSVQRALRYVADYYGSDRCLVMTNVKGSKYCKISYLYHRRDNMTSSAENTFDMDKYSAIKLRFSLSGSIRYRTKEEIRIYSKEVYDLFEKLGIEKILSIGLKISDQTDGLLAVFDMTQNEKEGSLLETVAYYVVNALNRLESQSNAPILEGFPKKALDRIPENSLSLLDLEHTINHAKHSEKKPLPKKK